jgi:superfamily II DNA or RNA helicase
MKNGVTVMLAIPTQTIVSWNNELWVTNSEPRNGNREVYNLKNYKRDFAPINELEIWKREKNDGKSIINEIGLQLFFKKGREGMRFRPPSTDFRSWQYRPLVIFENHANRQGLLIADEVGTGKTFSACNIMYDSYVNSKIDRCLILCPANLVKKWKEVIRRKYHLRCGEAGNAQVLKKWLKGDDNGFDILISSYHKGSAGDGEEKIIDNLELNLDKLKSIDLLIIDEIHNVIGLGNNSDNKDKRKLANLISTISTSRIGLTATPFWHSERDIIEISKIIKPLCTENMTPKEMIENQRIYNNTTNLLKSNKLDVDKWNQNLKHISSIMNKDTISQCNRIDENTSKSQRLKLSSDISKQSPYHSWVTRTTSEEAGLDTKRIIPDLDLVDLDDKKGIEIYDPGKDEIIQFKSEKEIFEELEKILKAGSHKLELSSSPNSFTQKISRIIGKNQINIEDANKAQELASHLEQIGVGSKEKKLINCINNIKEKRKGLVLFTRWHGTFDRLTGDSLNLEGKIDGIKIFRATYKDEKERDSIKKQFDGYDGNDFPILIATDMLSEGIDLQKNADTIIHYDLPKNPQKVEQRIGRIDRIGQESDSIEIRYIIIRNSADHRFLSMMNDKIMDFESVVGNMRPITPENFVYSNNHGGVDSEMKETIEKMYIEEIKVLEFDKFNDKDLPDELRKKESISSNLISKILKNMIKLIIPADELNRGEEDTIKFKFKSKEKLSQWMKFLVLICPKNEEQELMKDLKYYLNSQDLSFTIPIKENGSIKGRFFPSMIENLTFQASPVIEREIINCDEEIGILHFYIIEGKKISTKHIVLQEKNNQIKELKPDEYLKMLKKLEGKKLNLGEKNVNFNSSEEIIERLVEKEIHSEQRWKKNELMAIYRRKMAIAKRLEESGEDEEKVRKLRNDANHSKNTAETDLTTLEVHVESTRLGTFVGG